MQVRYRTQFVANDGTQWRIDILDADTSVSSVTEFRLAYEGGAVIDWGETDKTDPVASSSLTLRLLSLSDRQWIGLYHTQVGALRADVFRNGNLYWSGTLDTELYEEPYSFDRDYEVEVTFSDFAILERRKFEATDLISLRQIIDLCLSQTGINHNGITEMIALRRSAESPLLLNEIFINADNFRDDDGEPQNLREVLEAVLTPLGFRIQQKNGRVFLYDLQGLLDNATSQQIQWMGDDASLGVDKTFSDVTVTFSPGAKKTLADCSLNHDDILKNETDYWSFNLDTATSDNLEGFRIFSGTQPDLTFDLLNGARLFRIDPIYSGSDEAGVAWNFKGGSAPGYSERDSWRLDNGGIPVFDYQFTPIIRWSGMIARSGSNPLPGHRSSVIYAPERFRLRVSVSLLFDPRYNPFESEDNDNNFKNNYKKLKDNANFAYIPFRLILKDDNGNVLYHYKNDDIQSQPSNPSRLVGARWEAGSPQGHDSYLEFYDFDDRKNATGLGGWKTNRQAIGGYKGKLLRIYEKRGDGEFIDIPPVGGTLVLEIGKGIIIYNDNGSQKQELYSNARWMLFKDIKIEIVRIDGTDFDPEDIEDRAWIDRDAKEKLSISTTVGTLDGFVPAARGALLNADLSVLQSLHRAGYDDRVERLLIASIFSQYATRHTSLAGTAALIPDFRLLSDAASPGLSLIPLAEAQDLVQATSTITAVELSTENYAAVDWDDDNQQS